MCIPEICKNTAIKQVCDQFVSMISIAKSCPGIDSLSHTPACCLIYTVFHGNSCCCQPFRCIYRNQVAREQSQHMRKMSVVVALSEAVYGCLCIPFFDLTALSYFDRSFQLTLLFFPFCYFGCITLTNDICCFDGILIKLPYQCLLVCITACLWSMLR